jgi:hypothetical protein
MKIAFRSVAAFFLLCASFALAQSSSGRGIYSGAAVFYGAASAQTFFAALPLYWVDNTVCNPPGGTYDVTVILGTTDNIGPNNAGESVGAPYALTYLGLLDAMNNWRDNADDASQTPHFADKWWLIEVPAGTVLHGSTYDANDALISLPGKLNSGAEPAKCLVIDSTTPLTSGVMACGRGLPGFGGTRNPGCASPNDKASMWKVQLDTMGSPAGSGRIGVYAGADLATPANWVSHIVLRDIEVTMAPGAAQSAAGVHAARLINIASNPLNTTPPTAIQAVTHVGLDRYYVHGWDPGDAGQPSGACSTWTNTGTVTVAPDGGGINSTVSFASGAYFGMTFTVGSLVNIGGTNYTIANTTLTQNVLNGLANTSFSIVGTVTLSIATAYAETNPPSQYANGCGDDVENGVIFNCDNCWRQNGYIEKIHWWGNESHASLQGFSDGPYKDVNNWEEGGSAAYFSGGGPIDQNGGPESDQEIRRDYFGRDLNYRQLSGNSGNSPAPPWGCGPSDGTANHNTCPMNWAVKNSLELKLGHRVLIAGNIIENSWADGQQGFCRLVNARTCSGGSACGIYNFSTGLPNTYIDNIRFESNWIRNCPESDQMSNRSGSPGNGGGESLPVQNVDHINELFSNISDSGQFGAPGHEFEWTSGQNIFPCAMSRTSNYATAICLPYQSDITGHISEIASVSNVVTIYDASRIDPILCTGSGATCIANGQTVVITNHSGWNGTFAMTGTAGNWSADGTGGNNIVYTDTVNSPGTATLCNNAGSPTCTSLLASGDVTFASLGFKMTDIALTPTPDDVYAYNTTADTTCTSNGYAVGASSATYAAAGTITTGLTVVYYNPGSNDSSGATHCLINNGAGFPKNTTFQNNSVLAVNGFDVEAAAQWWQPINNRFFNNVFVDNDSGKDSDLDCVPIGAGEGYPSYPCWDANTFQFYSNVLVGRSSSNWNSGIAVPSSDAANTFPAIPGGYPSSSGCPAANAPFNCPLMALPWANNFTLSNVAAMSVTSSTQGVNVTQMTTTMTATEYTCPAGANCGTHGPYPD